MCRAPSPNHSDLHKARQARNAGNMMRILNMGGLQDGVSLRLHNYHGELMAGKGWGVLQRNTISLQSWHLRASCIISRMISILIQATANTSSRLFAAD